MKRGQDLLILALGLALLALLSPADAQSPAKTWRIGMLSTGVLPGHVVFIQTMRERGYVEGQNLTVVYGYAEGRTERVSQSAAELVGAKVDVIVTAGTMAAIAARKATGPFRSSP